MNKRIFDLFNNPARTFVSDCVNLIPATGCSGTLAPAPEPEFVIEPHWRPVAEHVVCDTVFTILADDDYAPGITRIGVRSRQASEVTTAGVVRGVVSCASSVTPTQVCIMTADSRAILSFDDESGRWSLATADNQRRVPAIRPRRGSVVNFSTGQLAFKGVDASEVTLPESAERQLRQALADAYTERVAAAAATGLWAQPLLVSLHLMGHSGETLCTTPAMLMSLDGWQATGEAEVSATRSSDGTLTTADIQIPLHCFDLELDLTTEIDADVASIEVWASPQLHPFDADRTAPSRIISRSSGLRFYTALPGATNRFASAHQQRAAAVMAIAPVADAFSQCVARVSVSASAGSKVIIKATHPGLSAGQSMAEMQTRAAQISAARLQSARIAGSSLELPDFSRFTAGAIWCGGAAVLYGNIAIPSAEPLHPAALFSAPNTATDAYAPWTAAIEVTMADGQRLVRQFDGVGLIPASLSPLISFPDRLATSWRLVIEADDGSVWAAIVPLSAAPSGDDMALHLSTDGLPIQLTFVDDALPASSPSVLRRYPSLLIMASTASPLTPQSAIHVGSGRIDAILSPSSAGGSGWASANDHAMIVTTKGLYYVTAYSATNRLAASHRFWDIGLTAWTSSPAGIILNSAGRLVADTGCNRTDFDIRLADNSLLGWHAGLNALLLTDRQGNTYFIFFDSHMKPFHLCRWQLPFAPKQLLTAADGGLWLWSDAGSHFLPAQPTAAQSTAISWCSSVNLQWREVVEGFSLNMLASHFKGSVVCSGGGGVGADNADVALRLDIDGELNHPLHERIIAPARSAGYLKVSGTASADFRLSRPYLSL